MSSVKHFRFGGLDWDGMLSTDVMYIFLVRVVKNGISLIKNTSKYSVTFLCMFLMVTDNFMVSSLTCRGWLWVVFPFTAAVIGP